MGLVADYLRQLIARQVEEHGLVVWYDPERAYQSVAESLSLPETTVVRYQDSFFQLRYDIDGLLNGEDPPRLVVYVPLAPSQTHNALIELEKAGVVMRPGQQPPPRNTKLAVVARHALKPILGEEQIAEIERQVEGGKLTLADLDALAEKGKGISTALIALIFGTSNAQEVALAFLGSDRHDAEIENKQAHAELRNLLSLAFDVQFPPTAGLSAVRERLARHVLLTDLKAGLGASLPEALSTVPTASSPQGVDACVRLARTWRNSHEHRASYRQAALKCEADYGIGPSSFVLGPLSSVPGARSAEERPGTNDKGLMTNDKGPGTKNRGLWSTDTLLSGEKALMRWVETELVQQVRPELLELATERQSRFWAEVEPGIQARWALTASAAEVLLEADRVARELKNAPAEVVPLVRAYAEGDKPWCRLDTFHRHLQSRKYHFEFSLGGEHDNLEKLIARAEQRYLEVSSALARHFIEALCRPGKPIGGVSRQRDCFETLVKPKLGVEKLAYVWVDALRFEMAWELARLLRDDFGVELRPALAAVPTVTEIGMAALLPKAHESAKVVALEGDRLALEIDGQVIKDRKDRVAFLQAHAGVPFFECKLDDLLPKPGKRVKEGLHRAELILVTSQEIDELCEGDNISQARSQMDGVLSQLRRGVRILSEHGIKTIVLVADHGHWFAGEVGEDMKIDPPGGKSVMLRRRVWVGQGGAPGSSYVRLPLSSLGMESEFDLATPWTFACFKAKGGARAYFHGGLSPQELVVPVAVLTPQAARLASAPGIVWSLTPGTAKLTTRFFSVQVAGSLDDPGLFLHEPPTVRVEIRANRKCVSQPVSASYGFEDATGEVKLRTSERDARRIEPNTVTLMITEEINQKTVGIHLLDASTHVELTSPLSVEAAIAF